MIMLIILAAGLLSSCMFAEARQTHRQFMANGNGLCRKAGTPKEIIATPGSAASSCALRCYGKHWCHGANFRNDECELFDAKATGEDLGSDPGCIYYEDSASTQFRTFAGSRRSRAEDKSAPEETLVLASAPHLVDIVFDCTLECRRRSWCVGFDANRLSGQCELYRLFQMTVPISTSMEAASADDVVGVVDQPILAAVPTDGLRSGSRLRFTFRTVDGPTAGVNDIQFNLHSNDDVALTIAIRYASAYVLRSSLINDVWSAHETDGGLPFAKGNLYTLDVFNHGPYFGLFVNDVAFVNYTHRIEPTTIDNIKIYHNIARDPFECRLTYDY